MATTDRSGYKQPMRLVLVTVLVACSSAAKPESHRPSDTGAVTEAKFKAMHAPPTAGPAVRNGQAIDLNGTRAYLSLPRGTGPFPAIVVIHEWWGLNANIEHWADRLASAGWAALAVDLYGGVVTADADVAMTTMKAVDDTRAAKVIADGLAFVKTDPRIQAPTRAVIGWCFGGGWSLQQAIMQPDLDAAVIYYGRLETDPKVLAKIEAPVLGVFGNQDDGIPPAAVDAFAEAMKQAGESLELHRYDAPHAFANPSSGNYDTKAAEAAYAEVRAFFAEHLRG